MDSKLAALLKGTSVGETSDIHLGNRDSTRTFGRLIDRGYTPVKTGLFGMFPDYRFMTKKRPVNLRGKIRDFDQQVMCASTYGLRGRDEHPVRRTPALTAFYDLINDSF